MIQYPMDNDNNDGNADPHSTDYGLDYTNSE